MAAMVAQRDGFVRMTVEEYEANIEAARQEGYQDGLAASEPLEGPDADQLEADYEREEVEDMLGEFPEEGIYDLPPEEDPYGQYSDEEDN